MSVQPAGVQRATHLPAGWPEACAAAAGDTPSDMLRVQFTDRNTDAQASAPVVSLRCPYCHQIGQFGAAAPSLHWMSTHPVNPRIGINCYAGPRICPNASCRSLVFVICEGGDLLASQPSELIDFDAENVPSNIAASLEEAVACHSAEAFRACALMVRRALEEMCAERGATGRDLKQRLTALGQNTLIPTELLEAADELRILGNDAAHIEAREYDAIGKDEAEIAIELAKEIVKATYQYGSLVQRLRALKRQRE